MCVYARKENVCAYLRWSEGDGGCVCVRQRDGVCVKESEREIEREREHAS